MSYFSDEADIEDWSSTVDQESGGVYDFEAMWRKGNHLTREKRQMKIIDMTPIHLENTIRLFRDSHDVTILRKELMRKRKDAVDYNMRVLGKFPKKK